MIIQGWYCCDKCKKKLFKVNKDCIVKNIEMKCGRCKEIIKVNIEPKSLS